MIYDIRDFGAVGDGKTKNTNAIQKAIDMANEKDMVLILGKGNETYQKLKNETLYY